MTSSELFILISIYLCKKQSKPQKFLKAHRRAASAAEHANAAAFFLVMTDLEFNFLGPCFFGEVPILFDWNTLFSLFGDPLLFCLPAKTETRIIISIVLEV